MNFIAYFKIKVFRIETTLSKIKISSVAESSAKMAWACFLFDKTLFDIFKLFRNYLFIYFILTSFYLSRIHHKFHALRIIFPYLTSFSTEHFTDCKNITESEKFKIYSAIFPHFFYLKMFFNDFFKTFLKSAKYLSALENFVNLVSSTFDWFCWYRRRSQTNLITSQEQW